VIDVRRWVEQRLQHRPGDLALFEQAVTHPSAGTMNYQRLEFLGDRVLGLVMAEWLSELFPREQEGKLSHRFTQLVSREYCGSVGAELGLAEVIKLGKQAREDRAAHSENVLGDVVEALIAALYLDAGLEQARQFIRRWWQSRVEAQGQAPRHPKSLLHEWAEGQRRKAPVYTVVDRSGPEHAPRFTVTASVGSAGEATGTGSTKREAESDAALTLLRQLGALRND
jgi:ribonuclease-3